MSLNLILKWSETDKNKPYQKMNIILAGNIIYKMVVLN